MRRIASTSRIFEPIVASSSRRIPRVAAALPTFNPVPSAAARRATSYARAYSTHSTAPPADLGPIPSISAENTYDIVIIGGGPAGLALASALGT